MTVEAGRPTTAAGRPFDLSVIVVSHGHDALVPACLGSMGPALEGLSAEILLVDNVPRGGMGAALANLEVPVRVFENARQLGLSANVNMAAAQARGRHLLILNPDTEHAAGRIADAIAFLAGHPTVGLLGCTLLNPDGTPQQSFRRFPDPAFLLARWLGAAHWPWQPPFYRRGLMQGEGGAAPHPVDWVFGAAMLLPMALFREVGGMDEDYRLYYEDVDLAWRLRRAGWQTWMFPSLSFVHAHQRTSARRPFSAPWRWHVRSGLRFLWRSRARWASGDNAPAQRPPPDSHG
jgi:N-acetylglucosaminyl-diphospho-decaprenol L-rhamnosyltransferase